MKHKEMREMTQKSTWYTTSQVLRDNVYFIADKDEFSVQVGILLLLKEVGGASNKDHLFEYINKGAMDVYIDSLLLNEQSIIFIPNSKTLDMMEKFTLLVNAPSTQQVDGEIEKQSYKGRPFFGFKANFPTKRDS